MNRQQSIILFDGVCNLCHGTVRFIIRRDAAARFKFASLQSERGRDLARQHGIDSLELDSILLIENGSLYNKSTAALHIARHLDGLWPALTLFRLLPTLFTDALYDFVGRRRYRWFGQQDLCTVSDTSAAERFLL